MLFFWKTNIIEEMPLFNLQLAAHMDVGGPKSLSSYRGKTTYNYLHRLLFRLRIGTLLAYTLVAISALILIVINV